MLKFSKANAKIHALSKVPSLQSYLKSKRKIYSLDLLSGYSCPYAVDCLSMAHVDSDGKRSIRDGKFTKFRCFSASQEVQYTNVFNSRKNNFDLLKKESMPGMYSLLSEAMPEDLGICRIHVGGDFFNRLYMAAWIMLAQKNPDKLFYAYTKSIRFWLKLRDEIESLPNFILTASYGGRNDPLIKSEGLRSARVVYSEQEAADLGLDIDHDDSHAADPSKRNQDFALLIHGTQPKGTDASKALQVLRKNKVKHSYNRKVAV